MKHLVVIFILTGLILCEDFPDFSSSRPGAANPSTPLQKGLLMVESGMDLASSDGLYLQSRYGLINGAEVYTVLPMDDGLDFIQSSIGAAYLIGDGTGKLPESSIYLHADQIFDSDKSSISLYLPFSTNYLGGQIGFENITNDSQLSYAISHGHSFSDFLAGFIEIYGGNPMTNFNEFAMSIDGGLTYMLASNLQVDLNVGTGLTDNGDDLFYAVGLAYQITSFWKN